MNDYKGKTYKIIPVTMTSMSAAVTDGVVVYDSVTDIEDLRDYLTVTGKMSNDTTMEIGKDDYELTLMSGTWGGAGTYSLRAQYTNDGGSTVQCVFNVTVYANGVASIKGCAYT